MEHLIIYFLKSIKNNDAKAIIRIIGLAIITLIFISPAYIFMFFFKRDLLLQNDLIITIISLLVFNIALSLVLFFIVSFRGIERTEEGFKDSGNIEEDIIRVICSMGIISISLIIVQCYRIIISDNSNMKIGVYTVCGVIIFIFLYNLFEFIKSVSK